MHRKSMIAFVVVGVVAAIPIVACSKKPAEDPSSLSGTDAGAPMYAPTNTVVVAPAADAGAPTATASATSTGPSVFDAAAQELLRQQIKVMADKDAKGMKADGPVIGGILNEGQTAEGQTTLLTGKCYTVVGTSMTQELDVSIALAIPIPNMAPVLAMDNQQGPQAVVAATPNCYKNALPMPIPVKIIVKATKGSGIAGAQLYMK